MYGKTTKVDYTRPQDVPIPQYMQFAFGGTAGMCGTFFVQPLDLIKNRMQLGKANEYRSLLHAFTSILAKEGIVGIYNGLSAGLLRQATYSTARLGIFTALVSTFTVNGVPPVFAMKACIGMFSGVCGALIGTPADVALIRMTADGRLPPEQRRNYRHVFHALSTIVKQEGVVGLWTGAIPTMGRAMVVNAAQLSSYSQAKEVLLKIGLGDNILTHFTSSMVAGLVTTVASLPVDICKTKIQNMKIVDGKPEFKGTMDAMRKIIASEGVLALWKGFMPYFLKIGPHTVLTFVFLEQFNSAYRLYKFKHQ